MLQKITLSNKVPLGQLSPLKYNNISRYWPSMFSKLFFFFLGNNGWNAFFCSQYIHFLNLGNILEQKVTTSPCLSCLPPALKQIFCDIFLLSFANDFSLSSIHIKQNILAPPLAFSKINQHPPFFSIFRCLSHTCVLSSVFLLLGQCHYPRVVYSSRSVFVWLFQREQQNGKLSWIKHSQRTALIMAKPIWTLEIVQQLTGFTESYGSHITLNTNFKVYSSGFKKVFHHANLLKYLNLELTFLSVKRALWIMKEHCELLSWTKPKVTWVSFSPFLTPHNISKSCSSVFFLLEDFL